MDFVRQPQNPLSWLRNHRNHRQSERVRWDSESGLGELVTKSNVGFSPMGNSVKGGENVFVGNEFHSTTIHVFPPPIPLIANPIPGPSAPFFRPYSGLEPASALEGDISRSQTHILQQRMAKPLPQVPEQAPSGFRGFSAEDATPGPSRRADSPIGTQSSTHQPHSMQRRKANSSQVKPGAPYSQTTQPGVQLPIVAQASTSGRPSTSPTSRYLSMAPQTSTFHEASSTATIYSDPSSNSQRPLEITGPPLRVTGPAFEGIRCLSSSPNGRCFIASTSSSSIRQGSPIYFWTDHNEQPQPLVGHIYGPSALCWAANGRYLVSASEDSICVWEILESRTPPRRLLFKPGGKGIRSIAVKPASPMTHILEILVVTHMGREKTEVHCWTLDVKDWKASRSRPICLAGIRDITCITWSPTDHSIIAAASTNGYLAVYDISQQDSPRVTYGMGHFKGAAITTLVYSDNGKLIALQSCKGDGQILSVDQQYGSVFTIPPPRGGGRERKSGPSPPVRERRRLLFFRDPPVLMRSYRHHIEFFRKEQDGRWVKMYSRQADGEVDQFVLYNEKDMEIPSLLCSITNELMIYIISVELISGHSASHPEY